MTVKPTATRHFHSESETVSCTARSGASVQRLQLTRPRTKRPRQERLLTRVHQGLTQSCHFLQFAPEKALCTVHEHLPRKFTSTYQGRSRALAMATVRSFFSSTQNTHQRVAVKKKIYSCFGNGASFWSRRHRP